MSKRNKQDIQFSNHIKEKTQTYHLIAAINFVFDSCTIWSNGFLELKSVYYSYVIQINESHHHR